MAHPTSLNFGCTDGHVMSQGLSGQAAVGHVNVGGAGSNYEFEVSMPGVTMM
jgi:hypothetical protein